MKEANKEVPFQRSLDEVKREMIEYFVGPQLSDEEKSIGRLAFYNNFDERRYREEQYSLADSILGEIEKEEKQDIKSRLLRESDLRILENKMATLQREIDTNMRDPGYEEAFFKFDSFSEDLFEACHERVEAENPGLDKDVFLGKYEQLCDDSLREVHDALIMNPS